MWCTVSVGFRLGRREERLGLSPSGKESMNGIALSVNYVDVFKGMAGDVKKAGSLYMWYVAEFDACGAA